MNKIFNKAQNKANEMAIKAKTTLDNARAEGYIDAFTVDRGKTPDRFDLVL